jgi:tetratricopeptide (TPR) repeat protein
MIETALVYIRSRDESRRFVGCGALVEGPYVVTCRHVWRDADGEKNGGVIVEFQRSRDESGEMRQADAHLVDACDTEKPAPDLVLLGIGDLPAGVLPLTVATEERFETGSGRIHAFIPSRAVDVFVKGTIESGTVAGGLRQISGDAAPGYWTEPGSSGSPAFIGDGMQLAGILRLSETGNPPVRQAFILPGTTIRRHMERMTKAKVAAGMGVDIATLEKAIPGLDLTNVPVGEIAARIAEKVAAIEAKAAERPAVSNAGEDIEKAREEAASNLGAMDTDAALAVWDRLLATEKDAFETLTRRRITMLAEKAAIHQLRLEYRDALAVLREVIRLDPDAAAYWVEIGDIELATGTIDSAFPSFEAALGVARKIMDERLVSVSLDRIGDVLVARNDLGGALKAYEEGLEIARRLMAADPSHAERARDVSVSVNKIGDVLVARNDLGGALKAYEEGLEIRRRLMAADPSHAERARDVSVSLAKIGIAERQQGQNKAACARFLEARAIIEPLAKGAPDNHIRQTDLRNIAAEIKRTGCN